MVNWLPQGHVKFPLRHGLEKAAKSLFLLSPGLGAGIGRYHNYPIYRNFMQAYFYSFYRRFTFRMNPMVPRRQISQVKHGDINRTGKLPHQIIVRTLTIFPSRQDSLC